MNENTIKGDHTCKFHGDQHHYVKHTLCGHEYCALAWKHCPRCHGAEDANMTQAYLDKQTHEAYEIELEKIRYATISYTTACSLYRSGVIGDEVYLAARAEYKAAQYRFDRAFEAAGC